MTFPIRLHVEGLTRFLVLGDNFNAGIRFPRRVKHCARHNAEASLGIGGSGQRAGDQREPHYHPKCLHSLHVINCLLATQIRRASPRGFSYYLSTRAR